MMATQKLRLPFAFAALAVAVSGPAFADARTVEVKVDDLDLSRPAGQAALDKRINSAIRKVCLSHISRSVMEQNEVKKCEADARNMVRPEIAQRIQRSSNTRVALGNAPQD
jgi:UrcA family protein